LTFPTQIEKALDDSNYSVMVMKTDNLFHIGTSKGEELWRLEKRLF